MDFHPITAPSLDDFKLLTQQAFAALPQIFRERCGNLIIQVADFATEEILDEMEISDPFELTGLYQGVDLTQKPLNDHFALPDEVWLYRRPILDEWAAHGAVSLGELIHHVLVHEIGHHFGLTDEQIERIEAQGG